MEKLRTTTIHRILKSLSPKRKRENKIICRSITPKATSYVTDHLNEHLRAIVEACELSLREINDNPNSYYQQHRYDLRVVKKAIEKLKKRDNDV